MLDGAARDPGRGGHGGGRRPAGGRHHRPRQHVRRPRLLPRRAARPTSRRSSAPRPTSSPRAGSTDPGATSTTSTTSRCSRRPRRATATSSRCRRTRTSTASTTSRASTSSCSSSTTRVSSAPPAASAARCRRRLLKDDYAAARRARRPVPVDLRARLVLRRAAGPRPARAAPGQPAAHPHRARHAGAAARHQRQPLHAPRRRRGARRAALRADRRHPRRPEALQVRRRRVLPEDRGRRCATCSPTTRRRATTRCSIAERADVEIEFGNAVLPVVPDAAGPRRGLVPPRARASRAPRTATATTPGPEVIERIEYELGVIKTMGFSAYFLVVWDLVRYAHARHPRRSGAGSAAGSCVAYCLRIVDIDPIRYDLLFERFLNPGRKQMPDIDMDFDSRYRGEMIKYAAERYGWDHVAQIVTFSTIKARAAVRDSARVLGYPYVVGDKIAKLMPPLDHGPRHAAAARASRRSPGTRTATRWPSELRTLYEADPDAKRVIDVARGLEGLRRQDGIHAAAVVITREPLTEYLPIQRKPEAGRQDRGRPDRHPVRDARRRGPRPPQDGLPRACATSTSSRSRSSSSSESTGSPSRHRPHPARRPEDLRPAARAATPSACSSSKAGRCGRCCARCADLVRGRRRARRAVPPGADGPELAQRVRRPQERAQAGRLPARRPRPRSSSPPTG